MQTSLRAVLCLFTVGCLASLTGCGSHQDIETVGRLGGYTTPHWGAMFAELPPVDAVDFSVERQRITDEDFAAIFPALQRLAPRRVSLGGQPITDKTIDLLNQLPWLEYVNLEGTQVTPAGRGRLKLSHFE
jgi:hypothetical protein